MNKNRQNTVKIIGGSWKRKNIFFYDSDGLRPSLNRIRDILFNWLGQDLSYKKCLDLFAGSGSTLIAAQLTQRKSFNLELEEKYCDVIVTRWVKMMQSNNKEYSVKRNGKVINWEI